MRTLARPSQAASKLLVVLMLLACAASPVAAQTKSDDPAQNPALFLESARKLLKWDEPAEPANIAGPIYFVGTQGLSVFLITGSEGHIVLNTGMPGSGPLIEASIRKLGFKPEDVKLLLVGHAHVDHAGGHAHLAQACKAQVAAIREEKELIESGGKTDFHYGSVKEFQFDPVKVGRVFQDGEEIKLGDIALTALLTGGHTRGSTTFAMKIVVDGKPYLVLFPNGTSVNPGYRVAKNPSYAGIGDDFRRTYRVLDSLKPDIWLMPHNDAYGYKDKLARSSQEGVKAWVDPDGYAKWLKAARDKFDDAVDREQKE